MESNTTTALKTAAVRLKTVSAASLLLLLLFVLLSAAGHAQTTGTTSDGFVYLAAANKQVSITGYTGTATVLTVTGTISVSGTNLPVTSIGESAFTSNSNLTSVTIPEGITSIESAAFLGCQNLGTITIPSTVTNIVSNALRNCLALTAISMPTPSSKYSTLNGVLFNRSRNTLIQFATGLTGSYTIPSTVTTLGTYAFASCSLTDITIPSSVITIGDNVFNGSRLPTIKIPSSVASIGNSAFYSSSLLSITMPTPNAVYSAVGGVLFNANQTTLIQFPAGMAGTYAVPNRVTSIAQYAFTGANDLTGVLISSSVSSIGTHAFSDCINLTAATFAGNAPSMGGGVFNNVSKNFTVYYVSGATGFATPNWIDSSSDSYPAIKLGHLPGFLKVSITPAAAVTAGARWQVDGGAWLVSGTVVSGLLTGTHTVTFNTVNGWDPPASKTVNIATNQLTTVNGVYLVMSGSLQVTLSPLAAVTAGAQWQVDGKGWQVSGTTVTGLSPGSHTVSFKAVNGWLTPSDQAVNIVSTQLTAASDTYAGGGVVTVFAAQNDPAPGVTDGKFLSVDSPAIDSFGDLVFKASLTGVSKPSPITNANNTGIWYYTGSSSSLLARTGTSAPDTLGAVYSSLSDPAMHEDGSVIFGGGLAGGDVLKNKSNATGVWLSDGMATNLVVRSGNSAADQPDSQYQQFTQIVTQTATDVAFLATLTGTGIKPKNNTGLWGADLSGTHHLIIGTGDSILAGTGQRTVATINAFPITTKERGQSRSVDTVDGNLTFVLTFTDKSSAICAATPQASGFGLEFVAATWDASVPGLGQTKWSAFGNPAVNSNGSVAFEATLVDTTTKAKGSCIWLDSGTTPALLELSGQTAPDCSGALYATFEDPVLNHNDQVAFIGSLQVAKNLATAKTASGIWANTSGTMRLVARTGSAAPGVAGGLFSEFDQIVLPDSGGPIFLAKVTGVKANQNTGVWSSDIHGQSTLLLQTGNRMNVNGVSKIVTAFTIFTACPQVSGQSRSFDASTRKVAFLVTFSDKTWAIIQMVAP